MSLRDEEVIREEMESAKETAEELDDDGQHMNAIAGMVVHRTLRWVTGEGEENLEDELMEISENEDE